MDQGFYSVINPGNFRKSQRLTAIVILAALALAACRGTVQPAATAPAGGQTQATAAAPKVLPTQAVEATQTAPATERPAATTTSTPQPTVESSPTVAAGAGGAVGNLDAQQAVFNAIDAVLEAGPYRTTTTITTDNKTTQITGEVIPPDRFHISLPGQEMVIVGDKSYMKQGDQWITMPGNFISSMLSSIAPITKEMKQNMTDFQVIGHDTVNGVAAMVYQYKLSFKTGDTALVSTNRVWLDTTTGLPIKQVSDGEFAGKQTHTEQTIEYDPDITIEAPTVK